MSRKNAACFDMIYATGMLLLVAITIVGLTGCAGSTATPATPANNQVLGVQLAAMAACDKLTHDNPKYLPSIESGTAAVQAALDSGSTYVVIKGLILARITDPRNAAYFDLVFTAVEQNLGTAGTGGLTTPIVKDSQAYVLIEAGLTGCRDGARLNPTPASAVKTSQDGGSGADPWGRRTR